MRKKWTHIFVCMMLAVFIAGCNKQVIEISDEEELRQEESVEGNEKNDEGTETETISAIKCPQILENRKALDLEGVISYIENDVVEQAMQQELYWFQNDFLTVCYTYDSETKESLMCMKLISSDTGNVLYETTISNPGTPWIQICTDKIAVSNLETGVIRLYDQKLQEIKNYQAEPGAVYLNPNSSIAYQFISNGGIQITELETGNTSMILENSRELYVSSCNGNTVSMSYIDLNTEFLSYAVLHLDTGILEQMPVDDSFYGVENANGIWLAGVMDEENQYLIGDAQNLYRYTAEPGKMPGLLANPNRILMTNMVDETTLQMSLYDKNGRFLSSCAMENVAFMGVNPIWSEEANGYFLILMDVNGKDRLYFWDMSVAVAGDDLILEPWQEAMVIPENSVVSQVYYDRATDLSETYGVTIKIAEQCETTSDEYLIKQELDEKYIEAGLDVLEKALASYPEDFIEQLCYGAYRTIEINLCGSIRDARAEENTGIGFTSFSGFVLQEGGTSRMVLDVRQYSTMEQTFYHEMSHFIDRKMAYDIENGKNLLYSEDRWETINPEDFSYANRKTNLPETVYTDQYDAYFMDIYSRTFAAEDRARILEYAMMGMPGMFENHEGRIEKLEYYCRCIRDAFDTTGWPQLTKWEETLVKVGGSL